MLFTWWNTTTVGTWLYNKRNGEHVGTDFQGNKYYRSKKIIPAGANSAFAGRERRWVIYNGNNDSSRVPAEWHGWLHHTFAQPSLPPLARTCPESGPMANARVSPSCATHSLWSVTRTGLEDAAVARGISHDKRSTPQS